jgi:hypothetical protein
MLFELSCRPGIGLGILSSFIERLSLVSKNTGIERKIAPFETQILNVGLFVGWSTILVPQFLRVSVVIVQLLFSLFRSMFVANGGSTVKLNERSVAPGWYGFRCRRHIFCDGSDCSKSGSFSPPGIARTGRSVRGPRRDSKPINLVCLFT